MSSPAHTLCGAIAALAVCFLLVWLNWLQLLIVFGIAGIGWGIWSWLSEPETRPSKERSPYAARRKSEPRSAARSRVVRSGNVYQFPRYNLRPGTAGDWSEAVD
ncbi:MAG TPA: hypothetical protein V6D08_02085 [Candidatus Obscuribacterales bacterium]